MKIQQQTKTLLIGGIITMLIGISAFVGGIEYQKRQQPALDFRTGSSMQLNQNGSRGMSRTGNQMGNRPISGEIISLSDTGVTVKTTDNSSK